MKINLRKIGSSAFYNNKLTSIQIPRSLVSIESEAFYAYYRDTITIVKIPKNVVTIGSYAFYNAEVYCEATEKPEGKPPPAATTATRGKTAAAPTASTAALRL